VSQSSHKTQTLSECNGEVAVEKLHFPQNSRNLGDRKCLRKTRTAFVGHRDAILFSRISREGVFQQPRDFSTITSRYSPKASVEICQSEKLFRLCFVFISGVVYGEDH
jgi:hypothetical protein